MYIHFFIIIRVSVCFDGFMIGQTDCPNQCSLSAGFDNAYGNRIWFMDKGGSKNFTSLITKFFIVVGILESNAEGCGRATIQNSDMDIIFPKDDIKTLYGCTPTFGAGKTLKLLVKSASESCKLQLVSSVLDNILKQGIQILFFR